MRYALQNVKDAETNRVFRQVQDALNELASGTQASAPIRNYSRASAVSVIAGGSRSLRAHLAADTWTTITYPHTETVRPNYMVSCYSETDPNRNVYHELKEVTVSSFQIRTQEACVMELNTFEITTELHLES